MQVDLSIIIVNYKTGELTKNCVDSLKKYTNKLPLRGKSIKYEVIVIDNSKNNIGFAAGNNKGIRESKGRYILLLNSDTLIHDNVLGEMVNWLDHNEKIGIATCSLKNEDGSIQGTGGYFPTLLRVFSWMTIQDLPFVDNIIAPFHPMKEKSFVRNDSFYRKNREIDWVTGAFMMIREKVIDEIGGLDEGYFMYTEDTDFCFRAKCPSTSLRPRGSDPMGSGCSSWRIVYNPKWSITHFGGKSSSSREFPIISEFKGVKTFYKKHYPAWQFPILRLLLKIGALARMIVLGILEGSESFKIYAKAFKEA